MTFPWESIRIILNVKKTLPLLVVALIVDLMMYSVRPDFYLFLLGCAIIVAVIILFFVQAYLVKVQKQMTNREHMAKLRR